MSTPLHFISRNEHIYQQVHPRFSDPMSLGLLERSALDVGHPDSIDPGRVRVLGPFQVGGDPMGDAFLRQGIEAVLRDAQDRQER